MVSALQQGGILNINIDDDVIEKLERVKDLLLDIKGLQEQNDIPAKVLRIDDVMKRFSISRNTAAAILKADDSPGYKIGTQWFIEEGEMLEYLKKKTRKGGQA